MGKPSDSPNSTENEMGGLIGIAAVGCIVLLLILKYIAPVTLGAGLGLVLYYSRYGHTLFDRIKTYLFSFAFMTLLYWVLIGLRAPLER